MSKIDCFTKLNSTLIRIFRTLQLFRGLRHYRMNYEFANDVVIEVVSNCYRQHPPALHYMVPSTRSAVRARIFVWLVIVHAQLWCKCSEPQYTSSRSSSCWNSNYRTTTPWKMEKLRVYLIPNSQTDQINVLYDSFWFVTMNYTPTLKLRS